MTESRINTEEESDGAGRPGWVRHLGGVLGWGMLFVLGLYFFTPVTTVLLGILAATIVACALSPLARFIPGPRGVAALILGLGLIAVVGALLLAFSWPLAGPIQREVEKWPQTRTAVNHFLREWSDKLGLQSPIFTRPGVVKGSEASTQPVAQGPAVSVESLLGGLAGVLLGDGGSRLFSRSADVLMGILLSLAFIFIGSMFLLAEPAEGLLRPMLRVFPRERRLAVAAAFADLGPRYRRWVIGTLLSMFIVFTASALGYTVIGLELALPLALLAGLAEIVPTVGPATACLVAALFTAATGTGNQVLGVLLVYGIIQGLEAYIILPMIMRGAVRMPPVVTLFTVVLWGKIFGIPGLMLTIPINLTIATLVEHLYVRPREKRERAVEQ